MEVFYIYYGQCPIYKVVLYANKTFSIDWNEQLHCNKRSFTRKLYDHEPYHQLICAVEHGKSKYYNLVLRTGKNHYMLINSSISRFISKDAIMECIGCLHKKDNVSHFVVLTRNHVVLLNKKVRVLRTSYPQSIIKMDNPCAYLVYFQQHNLPHYKLTMHELHDGLWQNEKHNLRS